MQKHTELELIDELLEGREHSAALLGNDGLIGELKKRRAERMRSAEMDEHLDDEEQQAAGNPANQRYCEVDDAFGNTTTFHDDAG